MSYNVDKISKETIKGQAKQNMVINEILAKHKKTQPYLELYHSDTLDNRNVV